MGGRNKRVPKEQVNGMKAIIWVEVCCNNCGGVIGWNYNNAKSISKLKEATRNWIYDSEYGNLCPECKKKLRGKHGESM